MSCALWLTWRCRRARVTAREKVRLARALDELPWISEALRTGRIGCSTVRALTRVATPAGEGELHIALNGTTSQVETLVRGYRRATQGDCPEEVRDRHEMRSVEIYTDGDGMAPLHPQEAYLNRSSRNDRVFWDEIFPDGSNVNFSRSDLGQQFETDSLTFFGAVIFKQVDRNGRSRFLACGL